MVYHGATECNRVTVTVARLPWLPVHRSERPLELGRAQSGRAEAESRVRPTLGAAPISPLHTSVRYCTSGMAHQVWHISYGTSAGHHALVVLDEAGLEIVVEAAHRASMHGRGAGEVGAVHEALCVRGP